MKTCKRCSQEKSFDQFHKQASSPDGHNLYCKACIALFAVESRDRKREKDLAAAETLPLGPQISQFIRDNRKRLGLTQEELGAKTGVTGAQVRLWEAGKAFPQQRRVTAMCDLFGSDIPMFLKQTSDGRFPLDVATCVTCGVLFPVYKLGVKACSKSCGAKARDQSGAASSTWNGGKTKTTAGYVMERAPDHPDAYDNGYVMQHRLVMEQVLGRKLESWERVHHKNGIRTDNRPENLELWIVKGQSKKDPAGQRADDLIELLVSKAERYGIHPPALRAALQDMIFTGA